ncbi:hypothetical protein Mgra_00009382 [Meloidogyne graminicola]|uniref:Peptidase_M28 domain-containing protein n=1 Tax=Meloidogyne graminicola TaxID=189291 RepID=A0A8S9ZDC1_9BILA|nr:hypothetical protein Mgra_00009382 [Meloidogyne graminicola]
MLLFNKTKIIENLNWISLNVHIAGSKEQLNLMDKLEKKIHVWSEDYFRWKLISIGKSKLPKETKIDEQLKEQLENDPNINFWWNAYSSNGTVIGNIVYVNYGTNEDFELIKKLNITLTNKIVLIRYGGIFRGDKVFNAEKFGAIGVILFSDPIDYVLGNSKGSQRGTLYRGMGDPQTPLLPTLEYVHKEFNEENLRLIKMLPNIPVTSIGYSDAQKIFEQMDGITANWARWSGALPVIYRLTGDKLFRLDVKTQNVHGTIKNFIAKFEGSEEPDRWVLLGNHADAWTKGSIDPGTGTSIMLEIARVLSNYSKETGWRPKRTIMFCQWDAEEFGLIGSTEWVEQHLNQLKHRAIAYINLDNFNGNTTLNVKVTQPLESENKNGRYTLFDSWRFHNIRSTLNGDRSIPFIYLPHSGSDFQPFISLAGIPVVDFKMENIPYSFMLYHTAFEVPWLNEHFLDPKGLTSVALGQFWLEIIRQLADNIDVNNGKISISLFRREQINQRLILLERCFLLINNVKNNGNKENRQLMHSIFSAPMEEENSGYALPFLLDSVIRWKRAINSKNLNKAKEELQQISLSITWINYGIECAQDLLKIELE